MELERSSAFESLSHIMQSFRASAVQISSVEYLQYDFDTIIEATNNFSDGNKLGEGGFGKVYKVLYSSAYSFVLE